MSWATDVLLENLHTESRESLLRGRRELAQRLLDEVVFLPINERDDEIVNAIMRRRRASAKTRPLRRRSE